MPPVYRSTLSAFCLSVLMPCALPAWATQEAPSTAPATPTARVPLLERSEEDALALERQLPADEQQPLQAGSDNFLALWKPANGTEPLGIVIIVPGAGETADWPEAVGPLRRRLPDAQWATLSLSLPDLAGEAALATSKAPASAPAPVSADSQAAPPDAGAGVEKATAPGAENGYNPPINDANQDAAKADAERIFARIEAGVAFARQQNARSIVLLGHGTGAFWAARYLNERQAPHVQSLVLVDVRTPTDAVNSLAQLLPGIKVPAADIYYNDREQARAAAEQRLQASKRLKENTYRQIGLTPVRGDRSADQEQLSRRVRGWLAR
jgi:hypothetical protein